MRDGARSALYAHARAFAGLWFIGGWQRLSLRAAGSPSFPLRVRRIGPSLCLHRPVCCPLLLGESAVCSDVPVGMSLLVPTRRVPRPNWVCGAFGVDWVDLGVFFSGAVGLVPRPRRS